LSIDDGIPSWRPVSEDLAKDPSRPIAGLTTLVPDVHGIACEIPAPHPDIEIILDFLALSRFV
jgi:hypothetical protein